MKYNQRSVKPLYASEIVPYGQDSGFYAKVCEDSAHILVTITKDSRHATDQIPDFLDKSIPEDKLIIYIPEEQVAVIRSHTADVAGLPCQLLHFLRLEFMDMHKDVCDLSDLVRLLFEQTLAGQFL